MSFCRYFETGIEEPEILGSGSRFTSVVTTTSEEEALRAYRTGGRNYLYRITYATGKPRVIERWNEDDKCWKS